MRFRHSLLLISALVMLVVSSQRTLAHEGHDHDVAATSVTLPASPRAETSSETFELVAVARSGEIVIYLDGFQSNEPVLDANVEIETPQGSVHARPAGDDTYRFPAPWAANTGRYDLIATVTKGDNADILTFTIETPPSAQANPAAGSSGSALALDLKGRMSSRDSPGLVALLGAFLAGGFAGLFLARRRRAAQVLIATAVLPILAFSAFAHEGEDHSTPQTLPPAGTRDVAQMLVDGSSLSRKVLSAFSRSGRSFPSRRSIGAPSSFLAGLSPTRMPAGSYRLSSEVESRLLKADFRVSARV